jgi:hypothetical protein
LIPSKAPKESINPYIPTPINTAGLLHYPNPCYIPAPEYVITVSNI